MNQYLSKYVHAHSILAITAAFVLWKALILALVLLSPGLGYDTSTSQLAGPSLNTIEQYEDLPSSLKASWLKLVRWDAFYYLHIAQSGHVFEQEWAFGMGLSSVLQFLGHAWPHEDSLYQTVRIGVVISHVTHYLSTLLLWDVCCELHDGSNKNIPTIAAILHILSPAGVFLSAPYAESLFSFLNMLGFYLYVRSCKMLLFQRRPVGYPLLCLSGVAFGSATMIRSNGIFSGLPFLFDAGNTMLVIIKRGMLWRRVFFLSAVLIGGIFVSIGGFLPQYFAYQEFCLLGPDQKRQPWCDRTIPAIYTWVQSRYWNVGFLRYWRFPNSPLFLMAAPSLWALISSSIDALKGTEGVLLKVDQSRSSPVRNLRKHQQRILALPQFALALLAITNYHVQIITRLSSGYPLWFFWLASSLERSKPRLQGFIRCMIIYALLQAFLYGSFLPPA